MANVDSDSNKYPLNLLLVEDNADLNESYKKEIEGIELEEFKIVVKAFTGYDEALKSLEEDYIDMVVTDSKLDQETGQALLKQLNKSFYPSAILYSREEVHLPKELQGLNIKTISLVNGNDLILEVKKELDLNSKIFKNQTFLRGVYLTNFVELELQINEFLKVYFFQDTKDTSKKEEFNDLILGSKYNSFDNKTDALWGIIKTKYAEYKEKITQKKLNSITEYRNKIAHGQFRDKTFITHNTNKKPITERDIRNKLGEIKKITTSIKKLTAYLQKEV